MPDRSRSRVRFAVFVVIGTFLFVRNGRNQLFFDPRVLENFGRHGRAATANGNGNGQSEHGRQLV